ncbi:hypothetical protein [Pyrodictium abyssi]|uniref:Uncharacterized protein n=1 Tax=Pyrodictium abyssi TaxID=54256 RepID=A0ABM8IXC9_9CREN|nr:hypothetical protein PABY_17600 [Pyrodictium abyssi]
MKPRCRDVNVLPGKLEAMKRRYPSKRTVAVLAGALIGDDDEDYAEKKGVKSMQHLPTAKTAPCTVSVGFSPSATSTPPQH